MLDLRDLLGAPAVYRLFVRLVGSNYRETYVREYVRPVAGQRLFDIGCGPGDVLAYLPDVDYVGVDLNARYIRAANRRFGQRGIFRHENVADTVVRDAASFDTVMANGLLHHLTDDEVRHLSTLAHRGLKPGGRLVTFDGCLVPGQSFTARLMLGMDRGRHVRTKEAYTALAREVFGDVECHLRTDLLRIPYTHVIMVCRGTPPGHWGDPPDTMTH